MMTVIFSWLALICCEIARNYYIIEDKKQRPIYWQSNVGRVIVGFIFWVISPFWLWPSMTYWQWLGMVPMMVFSFWFLFDYGLNMVRQVKPFYYLNPEGSFLDRLQCNYPSPLPWFIWKFMAMLSGIDMFIEGINITWEGI